MPELKNPGVQHDLWMTSNDKQRQWLLDEVAAGRITRIKGRIEANKQAERPEPQRKWEGLQ